MAAPVTVHLVAGKLKDRQKALVEGATVTLTHATIGPVLSAITNSAGEFISMPHFGGVKIGNNVEIGPGSVIDCGTFGDTIIQSNVRIDNMVQIAHNVTIAGGSRIMAGVSISGGVQIGRDCWIAPKAMLRDKIKIGNNVLIGCSSMVTIDIPDNHKYQPTYAEIHKTAADCERDSK